MNKTKCIKVSALLEKPHPLVQALKKNLSENLGYLNKGMVSSRRGHLDVRIAPNSVDRALRIWDAICGSFRSFSGA